MTKLKDLVKVCAEEQLVTGPTNILGMMKYKSLQKWSNKYFEEEIQKLVEIGERVIKGKMKKLGSQFKRRWKHVSTENVRGYQRGIQRNHLCCEGNKESQNKTMNEKWEKRVVENLGEYQILL